MLEALVPISNRVEVRRNLDRLEMLLRSFSLFWKGHERLRLHVVVPDDEYKAISIWLHRYDDLPNLALSIISESEISPVLGSVTSGYGVMKQMLIKLAAFDFVKADNCLILDSDIVACRPFDENDLIINGKILSEWLKPSLYEWWFESARVLGYKLDVEELRQSRLFVTPQILSRHIVTPLLKEIESRLGASWIMGLIAEYSNVHPNIWTEYTLYDLYAAQNGLREKFHIGPDEISSVPLHCIKQSIWGAHSFETWEPERALDGVDPGYFLVLQSITAAQLDFNLVKDRWNTAISTRFSNYPV